MHLGRSGGYTELVRILAISTTSNLPEKKHRSGRWEWPPKGNMHFLRPAEEQLASSRNPALDIDTSFQVTWRSGSKVQPPLRGTQRFQTAQPLVARGQMHLSFPFSARIWYAIPIDMQQPDWAAEIWARKPCDMLIAASRYWDVLRA